MSPAGPVVVLDYRTHLHVIRSNAPKLLNCILLLFILAKLLFLDIPRLLARPAKIFLCYLLETALTAGTVCPFSIKSVLK